MCYREKKILNKQIFAPIVILIFIQLLFLFTSQLSNTYGINLNVPEITITTGSKEIVLKPFVEIGGDKLTKLGFPDLPDNDNPKISIDINKPIKVNYHDKEIKKVEGYVIDYDADVNEMIPLDNTGINKFEFPDSLGEGPKTLEIRILMTNNQKISYTVLAMLER